MPPRPAVPPGPTAGLLTLPPELLREIAPRPLGRAQPVGRLAAACRGLSQGLRREGRGGEPGGGGLRVGTISVSCLQTLSQGLARACLPELEALHVDLAAAPGCSQGRPRREQLEGSLQEVSRLLPQASSLRSFSLRLTAFDLALERLRLGPETWEALVCGLSGLARHGRLQLLELSSIPIKASQATQAIKGRQLRRSASSPTRSTAASSSGGGGSSSPRTGGASSGTSCAAACSASPCTSVVPGSAAVVEEEPTARSFLEALGRLTTLEELLLTHDEIFGSMAQLLPPVLNGMRRLRRLDLTRNHISKGDMEAFRAAMPRGVKLAGDDKQTFFFY